MIWHLAHQLADCEHRQRPLQEGQDALEHYNLAKKTFRKEQAAGAAGATTITDGHAQVSGDGIDTHGQGVAPHHLDMQDMTHGGASHERALPSQPETHPLVYIYHLPTPLVNCSRPDWAAYIYDAEVRLPEVSNACMSEISACPICLFKSRRFYDGWRSEH